MHHSKSHENSLVCSLVEWIWGGILQILQILLYVGNYSYECKMQNGTTALLAFAHNCGNYLSNIQQTCSHRFRVCLVLYCNPVIKITLLYN